MNDLPSPGFAFSGFAMHIDASASFHCGFRSVFSPHTRVRTPLCPSHSRYAVLPRSVSGQPPLALAGRCVHYEP